MGYIIGIDIGGTKCAVLLGTQQGGIGSRPVLRKKVLFETRKMEGPKEAIQMFIRTIREMEEEYSVERKDILGIGISCGGPLDRKSGLILNPPNLPGWVNVPVCRMLGREFGIPVTLENDANACALAEWKYGAGRGYSNVIFLTFGTGLGAGLILDGKLYHGTNDMAGEVGHIRLTECGPVGFGKMGSFEGYCSGGGISQGHLRHERKVSGKSTVHTDRHPEPGSHHHRKCVREEPGSALAPCKGRDREGEPCRFQGSLQGTAIPVGRSDRGLCGAGVG